MAQAKEITFEEFRKQYGTEEACRKELFRPRFPNGFVCPKCDCREYYPIRKRNTMMSERLTQAKTGQGIPVDEVFSLLRGDVHG